MYRRNSDYPGAGLCGTSPSPLNCSEHPFPTMTEYSGCQDIRDLIQCEVVNSEKLDLTHQRPVIHGMQCPEKSEYSASITFLLSTLTLT